MNPSAQKRAGKVLTGKYFYDKPNKEWKGGGGNGVGGGEEGVGRGEEEE
jgi:hypothetical protein